MEDWSTISKDIDFIAFVYDDVPLFLVDDWVLQAEKVLKGHRLAYAQKGIGLVLFPCGCVIPNKLFQMVDHRLGGMECLLMPGFVLDKEDVHWIDSYAGGHCKRRKEVLQSGVLRKYGHQLMSLRKSILEWKREINDTTISDTNNISVSSGVQIKGENQGLTVKLVQDGQFARKEHKEGASE